MTEEVREESRLLIGAAQRGWRKPLAERVDACRALGGLRVGFCDAGRGLVHFVPPREDFSSFRERERVRLSQDSPEDEYFSAELVGLTEHGFTFSCAAAGDLAFSSRDGWCVDEDLVDLSDYYLRAIEELGRSGHGRDKVCPVLFGEPHHQIDVDLYDSAMDELESADLGLDESQIDAVANCLAASPFHLVQGPPGTGKTYTLARLVERLVAEGHRVLVTAFTHRAIHQALVKIHGLLGGRCPVVKVADPIPGDDFPFPVYSTFAEAGLGADPGPYVIGATPFALWSTRLQAAHFDSAVLDETSQLTLPAAVMAMMRSDRWFFFGDHRQLPPVSLMHRDNPADASVFARLAKQSDPTTLNTTYRLNEPLTQWPSESFYSGLLKPSESIAAHRLALKVPPRTYPTILGREPSLLRVGLEHSGCRSRSDDEADLAADVVLDLLKGGVPAEEVGIVVPFRAQAARIRGLLRGGRFAGGYEDAGRAITVDTVERFQGQEREVVIYSFTSSDFPFLERLGDFLFQPQRLNVAVTRARTKVVLLHAAALREFAEGVRHRSDAADVFLTLLESAVSADAWED